MYDNDDHNIFENEDVTIINPPREKAAKSFDGDIFSKKPLGEPARGRGYSEAYLTRRFVVIMMIITMIVSSALSAFIATRVASSSHANKNLTYGTLEKATGSKLTVAQIIAKNENSVVEISTKSSATNMLGRTVISQGAGSGVIVREDGYIATNNHVIDGASSIVVKLHNGQEYSATLIGTDPDNDIAVIKIAAEGLNVAVIGDSAALNVGDLTIAIGNPLGSLGGTATTGIVSALERRLVIDNRTLTLIQTDAAINPGNSGGGLFNGAGELIGIVVAKSSGTGIEGLGFAIPINTAADIIDELITRGRISTKPVIGITVTDVSSDQAEASGVKTPGTYITEVTSAEADAAGLKAGDRVVSIDGKKITSSSDLIARVREHKIGDGIELVIDRDGKEITVQTKLIPSN